jgi:hypothetical protein
MLFLFIFYFMIQLRRMTREKNIFPNLDAFYDDDQRRLRSGEVEFGVMWRHEKLFAYWRVAWVKATGEIYATKQGPGNDAPVVVLGKIVSRDKLEQVLEGWVEVCGTPSSLVWLQGRLSDAQPGQLLAPVFDLPKQTF